MGHIYSDWYWARRKLDVSGSYHSNLVRVGIWQYTWKSEDVGSPTLDWHMCLHCYLNPDEHNPKLINRSWCCFCCYIPDCHQLCSWQYMASFGSIRWLQWRLYNRLTYDWYVGFSCVNRRIYRIDDYHCSRYYLYWHDWDNHSHNFNRFKLVQFSSRWHYSHWDNFCYVGILTFYHEPLWKCRYHYWRCHN